MARLLRVALGTLLLAATPALAQTQAQPPPQPLPILEQVRFQGLSVFGAADVLDELHLQEGAPLPAPAAALAEQLERHYRAEEYSYASVSAAFDSGTLVFTIDEGRIDEIEFEGVAPSLTRRFSERFDVHPGDVFNRRDVRRALARVLATTQGAIESAARPRSTGERTDPIQLVPENGRRVLVLHLRPRVGRFALNWGTDGREDWFSPVDGFAPAVGFTGTAFDPGGDNHTVVNGFVSYKFARDQVGYAVGIERPLFGNPRLFVGVEIHDVTASDDVWRLSRDEQSLVALGFKNTFRDYYDRRGVQAHAAVRVALQHEFIVAYRREHHEPLFNESDFSFFRDDRSYRPNSLATSGVLQGLVVGYTFDSRTFENATPARTYRRHQIDDLYGSSGGPAPGVRVEWTSEITSPAAFGGDFDFRRHIVNARAYTQPTPDQYFNARFLAGVVEGDPPPQRIFALGGIGSVRGYSFKEVRGERVALVNLEYKVVLGDRHVKGVAFFDAGRVARPVQGSSGAWLKGLGLGVELGDLQIAFGWRVDDIPKSLQVLVRFSPLF